MIVLRLSRLLASTSVRSSHRASLRMAQRKMRCFGTEKTLGPNELQCFRVSDNTELFLLRGDLTRWQGDAIVNAANEGMLGGGGVDGAIHRAAGPELLNACRKVDEVKPAPLSVLKERSSGFRLPARHVIHTVGPVYAKDVVSRPLLEMAYESCLEIANAEGFHTIAFPAISCGVYGYPLDAAAEVSLTTIAAHARNVEEVHFVLFGAPAWRAYLRAAESMFRKIHYERD